VLIQEEREQIAAEEAAAALLTKQKAEGGMSCKSRSKVVGTGVGGMRVQAGTLGMWRRKMLKGCAQCL
jgi:hypothetical protein